MGLLGEMPWVAELPGVVKPLASYSSLTTKLRKVFDHPGQGKDASKKLSFYWGSGSVADYSVEFHSIAAGCITLLTCSLSLQQHTVFKSRFSSHLLLDCTVYLCGKNARPFLSKFFASFVFCLFP